MNSFLIGNHIIEDVLTKRLEEHDKECSISPEIVSPSKRMRLDSGV